MNSIAPDIIDNVREAVHSDRYAVYLRNTLLELASLDTAPDMDLEQTASRERTFFDWIEREIRDLLGPDVIIERPVINVAIESDSAYTPPRYAADEQVVIRSASEVYADRGNMVVQLPGSDSQQEPALILQAPVDIASPWSSPRSAGERVFGRGVCDSKAQVAVLLAQLKLMRELAEKSGRQLVRTIVIQLAIDSVAGGNGSLALVKDEPFARLPVLMLQPTDLSPHCAHTGVLYYRCMLSVGDYRNVSAVELFPFVVHELELEGKRIREETDQPMFRPAHIVSNPGILGVFGQDACTVCDHVVIEIESQFKANPERVAMKMIEFMEEALADYVRNYGDKRKETNPATGKPKLARHFELKVSSTPEAHCFRLDVFGKSGHMAAIADCDNAIVKASYLLGALLRIAPSFPGIRAQGRLAGDTNGNPGQIVLEGAQSFSPAHQSADLNDRLTAAAQRGVKQYCRLRQIEFNETMIRLAFDRHCCQPYLASEDIPPMQALQSAFAAINEPWPEPSALPSGCDARLYGAHQHPVAIFGPGKLEARRTDDEYVDIGDLQKALAVCTLATLSLAESNQ